MFLALFQFLPHNVKKSKPVHSVSVPPCLPCAVRVDPFTCFWWAWRVGGSKFLIVLHEKQVFLMSQSPNALSSTQWLDPHCSGAGWRYCWRMVFHESLGRYSLSHWTSGWSHFNLSICRLGPKPIVMPPAVHRACQIRHEQPGGGCASAWGGVSRPSARMDWLGLKKTRP